MFENVSKKEHLSGYTGYIPQFQHGKFTGPIQGSKQKIPGKTLRSSIGYQGFVPSIKAENMFSENFTKTSYKSKTGEVCKGRDLPPDERYKTMSMEHHKSPATMNAPSVSATVGVKREIEMFAAVR